MTETPQKDPDSAGAARVERARPARIVIEPRPSHDHVMAVLGPTNTGKTHLAVERMLAHESGIIGLPLRLLAREIYDRMVEAKGARLVALITGEEKIIPDGARYYVCTTESMPADNSIEDRPVAFVAVDEVQLAADPERGHVFTDRLLHARGEEETMFLGAETMRTALSRLLPSVDFTSRPRLSDLTYGGPKKLSRLPRRAAVVAFSVEEVYRTAELIRQQRGGAAVVMGALSPRTRNAQVALYEAGDVDYLVATDAIGMGLNLDVDHVAFAGLKKFDGTVHRDLRASEIAQIAGRAGRYFNDGTFGTTGDAPPLTPEIIEAVEGHQFPSVNALKWRNTDLDFSSIETLIATLEYFPEQNGLQRSAGAVDIMSLRILSKLASIEALPSSEQTSRLLWEVCQIPDFRKIMTDDHVSLLETVFVQLHDQNGHIDENWLNGQIRAVDNIEGDIDSLAARLAHIRTWTYVSNKAGWLTDPDHWQGFAREVEDRLSDALHEGLTERFIDVRSSHVIRRLVEDENTLAGIDKDGEVTIEGHFVGRLRGFEFTPDPRAGTEGIRTIRYAAGKALKDELDRRALALRNADDTTFRVTDTGHVLWRGGPVAKLIKGASALSPAIELVGADLLSRDANEAVIDRLKSWLERYLHEQLGPLFALTNADLQGQAKGIAFQIVEGLGVVRRRQVIPLLRDMTREDRTGLRKQHVRIGENSIFLPILLKPGATFLRLLLWRLASDIKEPLTPPPPGLVTVPAEKNLPDGFYDICGFRQCGSRAVRIDMLERLSVELRKSGKTGPFELTAEHMSLVGCSGGEFAEIVNALSYRKIKPGAESGGAEGEPPVLYEWQRQKRPVRRNAEKQSHADPQKPSNKTPNRKRTASRSTGRRSQPPNPNSPFAGLAAFKDQLTAREKK